MQMAARATIPKILAIFRTSFGLMRSEVPEVKPPEDGAASLKRDAAIAAFDYVKPGRHKPDRRR